jgi:large subunit ribosomal protein L33
MLRAPFWESSMRDLIKLSCQTCKRDNYVTDKNKRTMTEKFAIKKFCRACGKHTEHKEGKISKG